jgi:hypothetical protein
MAAMTEPNAMILPRLRELIEEQGYSQSRAAAVLGVNKGIVSGLARRHNLKKRFRGATDPNFNLPWPEDKKQRFVRLYQAGFSYALLAREFGICQRTVYSRAKRLGLLHDKKRETLFTLRNINKRERPKPAKHERGESNLKERLKAMEEIAPDPKAIVPLNKAKRNQCRWPLGEPAPDMPVCGMKAVAGRYCLHHYRKSIDTESRNGRRTNYAIRRSKFRVTQYIKA